MFCFLYIDILWVFQLFDFLHMFLDNFYQLSLVLLFDCKFLLLRSSKLSFDIAYFYREFLVYLLEGFWEYMSHSFKKVINPQ